LSDLVSILWASLQISGLLSDTIWRKASALGILMVDLVILVSSMKYHLNDCESNHRIRLGFEVTRMQVQDVATWAIT
jgi:hypothetical protein